MRNRSTNAERKLLTFFFKKEGHIRNYAFKSNLIKFTSLLLFLCLSVFTSKAQTTLINPTGDGGFENGSTFSSNGWTVVNYGTGTNNDWFLGNAPVTFAGTNVAYVSNTSGATWNYSNATTSTSHFYRDITVPAGENVLSLNFQWKGNGESGWDRLLIYAAPITVVPATGTPASNSTVFTGATLLYTQTVFPQAAYTNASVNFINGFGSTFRLIFTWQNDASLGTTPPVAIDNISLVSSVPANYTATAQGGLWSSPATWVGGVVPPTGNNVIIPAGSIVTVDQVISVGNIDINGILQWNATATNTLTAFGNITIGSTGRFLPYTTAGAGVALNVGGDFINNGYANLAVHNTTTATGCLLTFNGSIQGSSLAQTLGGTGYFEGNGLRGIIRGLFFTTTGNSTISTTQNLITYSMVHTAGSLNTNGKLVIDNTSLFYGQPINTQVSSVHRSEEHTSELQSH